MKVGVCNNHNYKQRILQTLKCKANTCCTLLLLRGKRGGGAEEGGGGRVVGRGGQGFRKDVPGVAAYFLARGETAAGVEALISQGALGDPTPSVPASTSALPGLFSKRLGLPTDPGA